MLEARLPSPVILKKLLDAIKELVTDVKFECNEEGLKLQAMDNSHVALVAVALHESAFSMYRCDRPIPLGLNINSLSKVIKCAKDDDIVTLRATDDVDTLHLTYESKHSDRIAEYAMKLLDIDQDQLGIPDTEYDATVRMSSNEFQRIVRDLANLGESVRIEVNKEGIKFTAEGETANGTVLLKPSGGGKIERVPPKSEEKSKVKKEEGEDEEPTNVDDSDEEDSPKKKKVKKDKKKSSGDDDGDQDMDEDDGGAPEEGASNKAASDAESESDNEDEEDSGSKKRKRSSNSNAAAKKKSKGDSAKKGKGKKKDDDDDDGEESGATIHMNQHVSVTFSLKYLVNFAKSASLCKNVLLKMSNEVPLMVKYDFGGGSIDYYLAPKIGEE